ncbi:MAG: phosphoribosylformylglycinamidine cyclo-ligase [Candidatus Marinimicrobia bacterium]|nr:phosphoribosylformylglycinamidine cyclo-ligase [Candidatus Neomarinimicrobiota bacterium]MBT7172504.1 phosphoribosylformylglycinamidine cyclo-ligase [Candidatus Neomarinimicrobiota bacterium]
MKQKISYKDAGVDIEKADHVIASSKKIIQSTFNKNVLSSIGGFGSMYSIKDIVNRYEDPVMVQSIDGVGTKMAVAQKCNNFSFIGFDLVNACCNDVAATGATPLTFLDYIASSSLEPQIVSDIIESVATECKNLGVSLVGGETAEMPGIYHKNEYDLVGIATGIVERKDIVDGSSVKEGDLIMGIPSNGLHTNGYSLARKLIFDVLGLGVSDTLSDKTTTIEDALLAPHKNYSKMINLLIEKEFQVKSLAHITGGGLIDNMPRVFPRGFAAEINVNSWEKIPLFQFLVENLDLEINEMYRTFNMGIGLTIIIDPSQKDRLVKMLGANNCLEIGVIVSNSSKQVYLNDK